MRKIDGAIKQDGRIYVAGDEDALAPLLSPASVGRLLAKGAISGDWAPKSPEPLATVEPVESPTEAPASPQPPVVEPTAAAPKAAPAKRTPRNRKRGR